MGFFTCGATLVKKPHTQFTCVTFCLPVQTIKFTCFYAASSSRRIHVTARNETRKLRLTSPAACKLSSLKLQNLTRGVGADWLQLWVILPKVAGIISCNCRYFCLHFRVFLCAIAGIFECKC